MSNQVTWHSQLCSDIPLRTPPTADPARIRRPWLNDDVLVVYNLDIAEDAWGTFDGPGGSFVEDDKAIANWPNTRLAQVRDKLRAYIRDQWRYRPFRAVQLDFLEMMTPFWEQLSARRRAGWERELWADPTRFRGAITGVPRTDWLLYCCTIAYALAGEARQAVRDLGGPRLKVVAPLFPTRLMWGGADDLGPPWMVSYPRFDGETATAGQSRNRWIVPVLSAFDAVLVQVYLRGIGVDAPKDAMPTTWPRGEIPLEAQRDYVEGNLYEGLRLARLAGGLPTWLMMTTRYCQHSAFEGPRAIYREPVPIRRADMHIVHQALARIAHKGVRVEQAHVWDCIGTKARVGIEPADQASRIRTWLDSVAIASAAAAGPTAGAA